VVIVMNQSDKHTPFNLWIKGQAAEAVAYPHSISTLIF
jgi:glucosylceramidase